MNIPRIRIEDIDEISILICYLIYALGCPLTTNQIIEITSLEEAVGYFNLMQAIDKSSDRLFEEIVIDEKKAFRNTVIGIKTARELGDTLPLSIREKMYKEAVRVYTRDTMKKNGTFLSTSSVKNPDNTVTLSITVMDTDTAKQRYSLSVETENSEQAETIQSRLKKNPNDFAKMLDDYFFNLR